MCYLPSGCIIFSLRKLKFYGGQGPDNSNTRVNTINHNEIQDENEQEIA